MFRKPGNPTDYNNECTTHTRPKNFNSLIDKIFPVLRKSHNFSRNKYFTSHISWKIVEDTNFLKRKKCFSGYPCIVNTHIQNRRISGFNTYIPTRAFSFLSNEHIDSLTSRQLKNSSRQSSTTRPLETFSAFSTSCTFRYHPAINKEEQIFRSSILLVYVFVLLLSSYSIGNENLDH